MDEPSQWPDGQRVAVLPHLDGDPVGTEVPEIELPDGQVVPFNGSPEHFHLLTEQMDRHNSVEFTPEEADDFQASLEEMDRFYRDALRKSAE